MLAGLRLPVHLRPVGERLLLLCLGSIGEQARLQRVVAISSGSGQDRPAIWLCAARAPAPLLGCRDGLPKKGLGAAQLTLTDASTTWLQGVYGNTSRMDWTGTGVRKPPETSHSLTLALSRG